MKNFDQCDNVAAKFIHKLHTYDRKVIKQLYINIVALYNMLNGIDAFSEILSQFQSALFVNCLKVLSDQRIGEIMAGYLPFLLSKTLNYM